MHGQRQGRQAVPPGRVDGALRALHGGVLVFCPGTPPRGLCVRACVVWVLQLSSLKKSFFGVLFTCSPCWLACMLQFVGRAL